MGDDGEEDVYLVRREAGDDAVPVARSRLRHRVIEKQCHPVISDDKTHDSYAMQCFVAKVIQHLKGDAPDGSVNVISKQGLTSLRIHSDNAKQHFKSSKSIYFFTKQLVGGERRVRLHFDHVGLWRAWPRLVVIVPVLLFLKLPHTAPSLPISLSLLLSQVRACGTAWGAC